MMLFHIKASYTYHLYNFIVSANDENSAIDFVNEYLSGGRLYTKKVTFLGDTESEIFYEV